MLALVKSDKYPEFDNLELEREKDLSFRSWQGLKPAITGAIAPDFVLEKDNFHWQVFQNGVETNNPVSLRQLLNKTLVLAFYSSAWQEHGLDMLRQLSVIQHEVQTHDANLLIIHSEKGRGLEKLAWDNKLSLSFYFDSENSIAEKFGVYSDNDPVWNRFSGIDHNVPLLAAYVIAPYGRILYDHVEWNFTAEFPERNIILSLRLQEFNK
ncbi:MAG TPA: redoxin domain-containing protein [Mucilaginibacter sp.]|nr:redoxin domain-containing protein [Mucilaginibacter sp.]